MLVVISDLHFSDGSATPENIPCEAFAIWLDDVLALAQVNEAQELRLLFLGDIFDLLRTEYWFYPAPGVELPAPGAPQPTSFPVESRPWGAADINTRGGAPSPACLERAEQILDAIAERCAGPLAMLSGDLRAARASCPKAEEVVLDRIEAGFAELKARGVRVHRTYVPGNHDRLFLHGPRLKQKMLELLGAEESPSLHAFESADYGVIARHGHEWDLWNFEAYRDKQDVHGIPQAAYHLVPVGDVITTELAARAPYLAFLELKRRGLGPADVGAVYEHLKQVEDVRPLTAAIAWMLTEGRNPARSLPPPVRKVVMESLELVMKQLMADFMSIPFVHGWLDMHDRFNFGLDEADKIQGVDRALRFFSLDAIQQVLGVVEKLKLPLEPGLDECARGAAEERLLSEAWAHKGIRYCVYGHTHAYRHEPLTCAADGSEIVYLNSGTWRPRVTETRAGRSFVGYKEMSYLVFYRADEDALGHGAEPSPKGHSYETWNGLMLKRPRFPEQARAGQ
jgi:UDP-2,3-diacylglucosamine pyrophosphatase LpxH